MGNVNSSVHAHREILPKRLRDNENVNNENSDSMIVDTAEGVSISNASNNKGDSETKGIIVCFLNQKIREYAFKHHKNKKQYFFNHLFPDQFPNTKYRIFWPTNLYKRRF